MTEPVPSFEDAILLEVAGLRDLVRGLYRHASLPVPAPLDGLESRSVRDEVDAAVAEVLPPLLEAVIPAATRGVAEAAGALAREALVLPEGSKVTATRRIVRDGQGEIVAVQDVEVPPAQFRPEVSGFLAVHDAD